MKRVLVRVRALYERVLEVEEDSDTGARGRVLQAARESSLWDTTKDSYGEVAPQIRGASAWGPVEGSEAVVEVIQSF